MPKRRKEPSQTWKTFLSNHIGQLVSIDFFTVPTLQLRVLFVFVILAHERRRVLHFNVTEHPTAEWTAQQIIEAFLEDVVPRYLIRDRDGVYGSHFRNRVQGMGIHEVLTAARSPWQNPFAERLVGSIRRECLNHVIVLGERHLRWTLKRYVRYYLDSRSHLSLEKDSPNSRPVQSVGQIMAIPQVRNPGPWPGVPVLPGFLGRMQRAKRRAVVGGPPPRSSQVFGPPRGHSLAGSARAVVGARRMGFVL